ncbi:GTP-binding protein [Clostridium sp.]|uniref:GTP-binding protein n=1 Tax=Clostridium sp. TaxID=1506 RepID=UPI002622538C|nr:GTP-binding protein [Clostridium sp.]
MKSKVELVTGFLESGKTTFINGYLNTDICKYNKTIVITFEKGNREIENPNCDVLYLKEIKDLENVIKRTRRGKVRKIIIEYNGTESLDKINELINSKIFKSNFQFYGNYFICNSKNIENYIKNLSEIIIPFIQTSKLIILNNIEHLQEEELERNIKILKEINLTAPIVLSKNLNTLQEDLLKNRFFKISKIEKILNKLKEVNKDDGF